MKLWVMNHHLGTVALRHRTGGEINDKHQVVHFNSSQLKF